MENANSVQFSECLRLLFHDDDVVVVDDDDDVYFLNDNQEQGVKNIVNIKYMNGNLNLYFFVALLVIIVKKHTHRMGHIY